LHLPRLLCAALCNDQLDRADVHGLGRLDCPVVAGLHQRRRGAHLIQAVAETGVLAVEFIRLVECLQRLLILVELAVRVAEPVPRDCPVIGFLQQFDALLIERDCLLGLAGGYEVSARLLYAVPNPGSAPIARLKRRWPRIVLHLEMDAAEPNQFCGLSASISIALS
jgi:hypothetical protein